MTRTFGEIDRVEKNLNPNKFFYIACEGHVTEVKYFQELNEVGELCKFVHFERSIEKKSHSAPSHVFTTLMENIHKESLDPAIDECWIVVDRDDWGVNLANAVQECLNNQCKFSVTSSCLEIWFIMHLVKIDTLLEPIKENLLANPKIEVDGEGEKIQFSVHYLDTLIKELLGEDAGYSKTQALPSAFFSEEKIQFAINQAKEIEQAITEPNYLYPQHHVGSQLYLLLENFMKFNKENSR